MRSVILLPYSPDWPRQFAAARVELRALFADCAVDLEHIGSTAIPGMVAKPVIDVLLGAESLLVIESRIASLERAGYQYIARYERELPTRRYFVKRENAGALRIHLHSVVRGSLIWLNHIAFRDALRSDPALRDSYQSLKLELALRFADDKPAYTDAKGPFVRSFLASR